MVRSFILVAIASLAACESKPTTDPWESKGSSAPPATANKDPWASPGDPPAPASTPTEAPPPPSGQNTALPQGDWRCDFISTQRMNGGNFTQTFEINGFTVNGDSFTSEKEGNGTLELDGLFLVFHGGGFDGWRGAFNVHRDNSPYIVFGGRAHRDSEPGKGYKAGDIQCEPRK